MDCRANLLAVTRAAVDGIALDDSPCCAATATFQVVAPIAPGLEVTVDVCTVHQQLTEMSLPGTRSVRKWPRVA